MQKTARSFRTGSSEECFLEYWPLDGFIQELDSAHVVALSYRHALGQRPREVKICAEQGKGEPNTRSVKTIEGNTETLRRYSIKTGNLGHEHSGELKLSKTGSVRVLTFYAVGDSPENGLSYIDKVDKDNFYDVPGALSVDRYARLLEAE